MDFGGKPLKDLAPLVGLTALQSLDLTGTQVSDVAPLAGLTALQSLYLAGTHVSDVAPLAHLDQLMIIGGPRRGKPSGRSPSRPRR